jgi:hypothetical protein
MKREKLDFTDKELTYMCLALSKYIGSRDTWFSKGSAIIVNNTIKKIYENGMKRKNKEKILYPLVNFDKIKD